MVMQEPQGLNSREIRILGEHCPAEGGELEASHLKETATSCVAWHGLDLIRAECALVAKDFRSNFAFVFVADSKYCRQHRQVKSECFVKCGINPLSWHVILPLTLQRVANLVQSRGPPVD